jgi:hypothetical protein
VLPMIYLVSVNKMLVICLKFFVAIWGFM